MPVLVLSFFFFFKQKTAYEMRISDWSSDVCSSDLVLPRRAAGVDWTRLVKPAHFGDPRYAGFDHLAFGWGERHFYLETPTWADVRPLTEIGRASCRERVCQYV